MVPIKNLMIANLLIRFLKILHLLIVLFVIFGFLAPNFAILCAHLIVLPLLVLHWSTNQGVCYLTEIEHNILGSVPLKSDLQGGFTESLIVKITGRKPTRIFLKRLTYSVMSFSWLISLIKIWQFSPI